MVSPSGFWLVAETCCKVRNKQVSVSMTPSLTLWSSLSAELCLAPASQHLHMGSHVPGEGRIPVAM